ncbi:oligosaccharide flippase family protein [Dryocola sp. BD626]|uniref:oligosaccharide flippase family protein n=1 Tax=Dryocola sp. BD626 TaxID=3133273 RepID=UPI003F508BC5
MIKSIFSMIVVRGITLVFPLMLIPIQLKLLGIEQYGQYNLLFAVSSIAAIIINYGFDYTACREIARHENKKFHNITWSSVLLCKCIIYSLMIGVLAIVFLIKNYCLLSFIGISVFLMSQILVPIYIFQGLKRMSYLIYNTMFLNVLYFIFILFLLKYYPQTTKDILFLGYAFINMLAAIQMNVYVLKKTNLRICKVSSHLVYKQFKNGFLVFLSRIMSAGLSQFTLVILSSMLSPGLLGIYSLGDKLVRAANSFFYAVQQATYPYFCNGKKSANEKKFLLLLMVLISLSIFSVFVFHLSKNIVIIFFPAIEQYYHEMTIMFLALIPMTISGMIGVNYLLASNLNKEFAMSLGIGAISNITLLLLCNIKNSLFLAIIILLTTEVIVAFAMTCILLKKRTFKNVSKK